jgi:hypothetical protein
VTREGHARFWERPEVKFLRATRHPHLSAVRHVTLTNLKVAAGPFRATAPLTSKALGLQEKAK